MTADDSNTDTSTHRYECQNCGSHVTARYARVRSYPGEQNPRACPECPDKIHGSSLGQQGGPVRDARSPRRSGSDNPSWGSRWEW